MLRRQEVNPNDEQMVRRIGEPRQVPIRMAAGLSLLMSSALLAHAFCGFYVAKADTKLFNKASQVVLVRHEDKTVLTMANDYQGDPKEFAIVIPVPTFLEKEQIHIGDKALLDHLDAYSAPRLVEYFDPDPCHPVGEAFRARYGSAPSASLAAPQAAADALGVKVEAQYTVGEYDIVILSSEQSSGLETWLTQNGYRIPKGAATVLGSYIKQNMRFFVAKVNLEEKGRLGYTYLRPIQVAYESPKFMLPIRLGMVNANGPQELFIYALSQKGRVETINYRTVKLPTGMDLPVYVKEIFSDFYRAMFDQQVRAEDMRVVFQEYAWDMGWCDPCAANPLSNDELRKLGVFWLDSNTMPAPGQFTPMRRPVIGGPQNVFVTRLHLRYDGHHFPEDLVFQETADRVNFQGRYVLRHPWAGTTDCPQAKTYREQLAARQETEAATLANLTGWDISDIRRKMGKTDSVAPGPRNGIKKFGKIRGVWPADCLLHTLSSHHRMRRGVLFAGRRIGKICGRQRLERCGGLELP
jgi:hypothetical protein